VVVSSEHGIGPSEYLKKAENLSTSWATEVGYFEIYGKNLCRFGKRLATIVQKEVTIWCLKRDRI